MSGYVYEYVSPVKTLTDGIYSCDITLDDLLKELEAYADSCFGGSEDLQDAKYMSTALAYLGGLEIPSNWDDAQVICNHFSELCELEAYSLKIVG